MRNRVVTRRQVYANCALAAVTFAVCAALMTAAVIAHAPVGVVPFAVIVCIGCPMAAAFQLPATVSALRRMRAHRIDGEEMLTALRGQLARLPETDHPLGH